MLRNMAFVGADISFAASRDRSRGSRVVCDAIPGDGSVLVVGAAGTTGQEVVKELLKRNEKVIGLVTSPEKDVAFPSAPGSLDVVYGRFGEQSGLEAIEQVKDRVKAVVWGAGFVPGVPPAVIDNQAVKDTVDILKDKLRGNDKWVCEFDKGDSVNGFRNMDDVMLGGKSTSSVKISKDSSRDQFMNFSGKEEGDALQGRTLSSSRREAKFLPFLRFDLGLIFRNRDSSDLGTLRIIKWFTFASIRSDYNKPTLDLSDGTGIVLQVRGDGRSYKLVIRVNADPEFSYQVVFKTEKRSEEDPFQVIRIPYDRFLPMYQGKMQIKPLHGVFESMELVPSHVTSIGFLLSNIRYGPGFTDGDFRLDIKKIGTYSEAPPKLVHISSSGVTRPSWNKEKKETYPGSWNIPIVQLNPQNVLGEKLNGENHVRSSQIPYCIVRPVGLRDAYPSGLPYLQQGDRLVGVMSRRDLAKFVVDSLENPDLTYKTFELKTRHHAPKGAAQAFEKLNLDAVDL